MNNDRLEQAVFKIFRMTHEGQLLWDRKPAPMGWQRATDSVFPVYFEAKYQDRTLALFQERFPSENAYGERDGWALTSRLALLGNNREILFEFPPSRQVQGLFDAVRYKEANIDQFLDELLKPEPVNARQ